MTPKQIALYAKLPVIFMHLQYTIVTETLKVYGIWLKCIYKTYFNKSCQIFAMMIRCLWKHFALLKLSLVVQILGSRERG